MFTFKKIVLGTALAASALTAAAPASAQVYRTTRYNDSTATSIGGALLGLAIGAMVGTSSRGYDQSYYGQSYRNNGWYDGYRYNNGWFYDRRGERRYDRNSWQHRHRHHDRRDGYQSGYDSRGYDGRDYDDDRDDDRDNDQYGYDDRGGYDGTYNGGAYDTRGTYNGGAYDTRGTYNGGAYGNGYYNGGRGY